MSPPENSISRISESEETDLPEPDSPTTQTVSPGAMEKDTSLTPTTVPDFVSNWTRRFSIRAMGVSSMGPAPSSDLVR